MTALSACLDSLLAFRATPSYEYYEAAAEEDVPTYKVELAKVRCVCTQERF